MISLFDSYIPCKVAHIISSAYSNQSISIGDNCTIGAGAVVTKNVANNQLVKGNPAK